MVGKKELPFNRPAAKPGSRRVSCLPKLFGGSEERKEKRDVLLCDAVFSFHLLCDSAAKLS